MKSGGTLEDHAQHGITVGGDPISAFLWKRCPMVQQRKDQVVLDGPLRQPGAGNGQNLGSVVSEGNAHDPIVADHILLRTRLPLP